ncbi:uncharacterized protein [Littorina saxatilis]|uniref:uncharacterized protein n=1 Tax=Littorina saxatilis TaxID=31220 RepID=UPI0038B62147
MKKSDVTVYVSIYCFWVIFFMSDILAHLNGYYVSQVVGVFFRLFAAEIGVSIYLKLKGETDVLKRGLSMKPLLHPNLQWLDDLVHSLRIGLIVGCISASVVVHLFDRPELLGVENSANDSNK